MSNPTVVINVNDPFGGLTGAMGSDNSANDGRNHTVIQDANAGYAPTSTAAERRIVGFLVSYSKTASGEHWPIYLGKNSIGSALDNDIPLREKSVSSEHADLNVRRTSDATGQGEILIFKVSDKSSTLGVKVGGIDLVHLGGYKLLSTGEMIDIGNYRLYILCIDTIALNLTVNPDFNAMDDTENSLLNYDQREPNSTRIYQP